jgi:hypothetical protein
MHGKHSIKSYRMFDTGNIHNWKYKLSFHDWFVHVSNRPCTVNESVQECRLVQTHFWKSYNSHLLWFYVLGTVIEKRGKRNFPDSRHARTRAHTHYRRLSSAAWREPKEFTHWNFCKFLLTLLCTILTSILLRVTLLFGKVKSVISCSCSTVLFHNVCVLGT